MELQIKYKTLIMSKEAPLSTEELKNLLEDFSPYRLAYFMSLIDSISPSKYNSIFCPNLTPELRGILLKDRAMEAMEGCAFSTGTTWTNSEVDEVVNKWGSPMRSRGKKEDNLPKKFIKE